MFFESAVFKYTNIYWFVFLQQRDLKKKFPTLNPFQKNKRVIPKFRGEKIQIMYRKKKKVVLLASCHDDKCSCLKQWTPYFTVINLTKKKPKTES